MWEYCNFNLLFSINIYFEVSYFKIIIFFLIRKTKTILELNFVPIGLLQ